MNGCAFPVLSNRVVAQHLAKTFSGPAIAPHRAAWALLKHADFRRVWFAGGLFGTIRWLEMLSVGVYTFDRTGSPLLVSAMMVARMLPMILFGSVFGAYAERFERRRLLLTGLSLMVVLSIVMAGLGQWIEYPLWLLAIAMFASGTFFATDFPVRRTILAEIAGVTRIGNAMAIDSATNNATRMVGPALGGIVYQSLGLKGAYALAAIVLSVCLLLVLTVRFRSKPSLQLSTSVFANMVEGFRYIKGQPRLVGALVITM
ncbi:MAG: MFS transporter, partial [Gammaproteobacteria bacterium]|nr:MFS transporter [Gammaproteobacteria bacterium]